ncbi:MAG TPA: HU family DNA-binding protein [Bryobacteraceae bacterium]|nr:HU family DNA-binding protein [Bryobacteraceae bacterium]
MKREDLARKLARKTHLSSAQARDRIGEMVHEIVKSLREGRPVELPGMGKLVAKPANSQKTEKRGDE